MPQPFINSTIELSQGGTEVAYRSEVDSRIFSEQAGIHSVTIASVKSSVTTIMIHDL